MRIAVIGTGIAGNAAAWSWSKRNPVTVYERDMRAGGHSHTVTINYDGTPIAVDVGFIVSNDLNVAARHVQDYCRHPLGGAAALAQGATTRASPERHGRWQLGERHAR
jgi:flavin-dependent dehydrogenase